MEVKAEVEVEVEAAGTLTGPQRRAPVDEGVLDELDVEEGEDLGVHLLARRRHACLARWRASACAAGEVAAMPPSTRRAMSGFDNEYALS